MLPYIGRFAPSPTGDLHRGSIFAALISYLDAKAHNGKWLLRIEDLDRSRCRQELASAILRTLEAFGLFWDDTVIYQSARLATYRDYLVFLTERQLVYPCFCSRRTLRSKSRVVNNELVYNGHCRHYPASSGAGKTPALRLIVPDRVIYFRDDWLGVTAQNLQHQVGDFIIKRADGCYSYQFAVVIDDALQRITHVVRGRDLLNSTPRQLYLGECLGFPVPRYRHFGLIVNSKGEKLAKAEKAAAAEKSQPIKILKFFLTVLFPGGEIPRADLPAELLSWAVSNWTKAHPPAADIVLPPYFAG